MEDLIQSRDSKLLVDDDGNVLNALARVLRKENHHVFAASNSSDALRMLEQNKIDLILADYKIGNDSGLELLKTVMHRFPRIIRMLVTGTPDIDLITELRTNKDIIHGYINKPWDNEALKNRIRMYLINIKKAPVKP